MLYLSKRDQIIDPIAAHVDLKTKLEKAGVLLPPLVKTLKLPRISYTLSQAITCSNVCLVKFLLRG